VCLPCCGGHFHGPAKALGLEFIAWERITRTAIAVCVGCGLVAGGAVITVARLAALPLGVEHGWRKAVLAVVLGPILEEVIFRGYLMSLAAASDETRASLFIRSFSALRGRAIRAGAPRHGWYHFAPTGLYCEHRMFIRMDQGTV
jgi:hypothetical protein